MATTRKTIKRKGTKRNRLNKKAAKPESAGISPAPFIIIATVLGLALTLYIGYRASISERKLFSVGLIALFAGLLFESFRVAGSWKKVAAIFAGSYLVSLVSFLPGKREKVYNFENHIEVWPYFFIFIFAISFALVYEDRVTAKLTEGITLLLSISLIYWTIDYGFINYHNWFSISLVIIGFLLSTFSIVNALSQIHLSKINRFILSVWSTVIMFAFAIDNIIRVFSNPDIESSYLSDGLYIGIQYFLLGVSAVYIMQNYMLLAAFLPSRNGNYEKKVKENKEAHIDRYSDEQVRVGQSLFCILFSGAVYWLNFQYHVLPRHTMIWLVFLAFPYVLSLTSLVIRPRT